MLLRILFLFFLISSIYCDTECPTVPSTSADRRTNTSSLRIMQYNAEWLFIDYCASSDCPGNGCTWKNNSQATAHLSTVANVIQTLNPDILNICEIEGCDELIYLLQQLPKEYAPYLKQGSDYSTGQNVGMLTKIDPAISLYRTENRVSYPMPNSKCGYTGSTQTTGVSKHYITEYKIGNINIAMISAHLIAFPTDAIRCAEREAQASVLNLIIQSYIQKYYEIIVLGDFNDFDEMVVDTNNNLPTSQVLDILKGKSIETQKYNYQLYSIANLIQKNMRYTDWYDENKDCKSSSTEFSMIDHILVSKNLYGKITNAFIYHGYDEYCGKYNSDHFPVVIDIDIA
jgi:exonuclease III